VATGRQVGWTKIMRAGVHPSLFGPTRAQGQRASGSPHSGADHEIRRETNRRTGLVEFVSVQGPIETAGVSKARSIK